MPSDHERFEWFATRWNVEMLPDVWRRSWSLTGDEFEAGHLRLGRNSGPALLFDCYWRGRIGQPELAAQLPSVWTMAEWPLQALSRSMWIEFFRLADYAPPAGPITLYRGTVSSHARSMAWTTDRDRARWFASRWHRFGKLGSRLPYVYAADAPPAAILADIDALQEDGGRGEREIVVDPALLPKLRRLETVEAQ